MDFLAGLNPEQRAAVTHTDGPLLILAGAGSGKTRVITHRMAYLMEHHRVPGPAILAVTFTNKAAGEMRDRTMDLLRDTPDGRGYGPMVSTFHSFCVRLLRQDGDDLAQIRPGFTRSFTIYDDDDQIAIIKASFRQLGLDDKFMQPRAALSRISQAKNRKETAVDFYKAADPKTQKLAVVFEQYEGRLRQSNALDFDDLLLESVRLLRHSERVRDAWNRRLGYLMIDEYQDTNRSQYDLMRLLSVGHSNVAVVGDEDQSIYGWRGADIKNILDFEHDYPNARVIRLEQNYRSTGNILKSAGSVVARNKQRKGKNLWTNSGEGEKIVLYEAPTSENEALWIADTIEQEIRRDDRVHVAVLYRTNSQSRQIEEALRRYNRKYTVVGGFSFYQRAEVKDMLAYLKVVVSPVDSISLARIINTPARGIGKTTLEEMERTAAASQVSLWTAMGQMLTAGQFSTRAESALRAFRRMIEGIQAEAEQLGPEGTLRRILDETGYQKMVEDDPSPEAESRRANLAELGNAAAEAGERGETLTEFLDHAALVSDADSVDEQSQISLLTMHNAKGLEFPVVFVAGMEEGLFPHSRARDSEEALEEERRLCYVAMTRAERRLYLTWARYRRRFGAGMPEASIPSRFLNEIPVHLVEMRKDGVSADEVNLYGEQSYAREAARRNLFTGKTYNSVENIAQFFADKGMQVAPRPPARTPEGPPARQGQAPLGRAPQPERPPLAAPPARGSVTGPQATAPPVPRQQSFLPPPPPKPSGPKPAVKKAAGGIRSGSIVEHPKYGRGTVLRKEGDGDDAKLTVSFPGRGLVKLVQKYAGITVKE